MTLYIILIFLSHLRGHGHQCQGIRHGREAQAHLPDIYFFHRGSGWHRRALYQDGRILRCSEDGEPCAEVFRQHRGYYEFTHLFAALAQTLGEGYALAQTGRVCEEGIQRKRTEWKSCEVPEQGYFRYFNGRPYRQRLLPHHHTGEQEEPSDVVRQQEIA